LLPINLLVIPQRDQFLWTIVYFRSLRGLIFTDWTFSNILRGQIFADVNIFFSPIYLWRVNYHFKNASISIKKQPCVTGKKTAK